jgi:hypothetical protein
MRFLRHKLSLASGGCIAAGDRLGTYLRDMLWNRIPLPRNVTFRSTSSHGRSLPRYFALHIGGMIFVYFATLWLRALGGFGSLGACLIATGLVSVASFIFSLTWVFASPSPIERGHAPKESVSGIAATARLSPIFRA